MTVAAPGASKWAGMAAAGAALGGIAAALVLAGNPGNMGLCGACFLRDAAGALGLHRAAPVQYLRPEIAGLLLGAAAAALARREFVGRSGSVAAFRFLFGFWMAVGALVFLGCPFRLLQRLGGGDGTAIAGLAGLLAGVGAGMLLEKRGYRIGTTAPEGRPVALLGPLTALAMLVVAFRFPGRLLASAAGPGSVHATTAVSLGLAALAGAILQTSRFCAISAVRGILLPERRPQTLAAVALIGAYAAALAVAGKWTPGFAGQPVSHADHLWSAVAMTLVGLTGALAGGCPVRQMIMAGEGNGDAMVGVAGIVAGAAVSHNLGLAAGPAGTTPAGRAAVVAGLVLCAALGVARARGATPRPAVA